MASFNPWASLAGETNQQKDDSMPAVETLNLGYEPPREPSDASVYNGITQFSRFSFHDSHLLGKGSSSLVFKGTFFDGQKVAIKRMQQAEAKVAKGEYAVLSRTSHTNVVKNLQIESDKNFIYLVLELCQTNLDKVVNEKMIKDYGTKVRLLYNIASGLDHLHINRIIHRDFKPSNILIKVSSVSGEIIPKISDFGISRKLVEGKNHYTATDGGLGTRIWCAPEVLDNSNRHITTAIDMFAYGCIVHFVMCPGSKLQLRHPFGVLKGDIGGDDIIRAIMAGRRHSYISTTAYKNAKAIDKTTRIFCDILTQDLTNVKPENRPSTKHVLNFPLYWNAAKQCCFLTDQHDYLNVYHEHHFEYFCRAFFAHKKLRRLCAEPTGWVTVSRQLAKAGLPIIPKTITSDNLFSNTLRVLRNNITHYLENNSLGGIPMESLLKNFHEQFPFFFPVLWVTYRQFQIHSKYPKSLENVRTKIEEYYTPLSIGDPDCLVTNLNFIKE